MAFAKFQYAVFESHRRLADGIGAGSDL